MNGVWLDLIALLINFVIVAFLIFKKSQNSEKTNIYRYLTIFSLVFSLNSLLLQINTNILISSVINKFYLVFFLILAFLFTCYSFVISNLKAKAKQYLFYFYLSFLIIISLLILFVPINNHLTITDIPTFLATIAEMFYFLNIIIFTIWYFINKKDNYVDGIPLIILLLLFGINLLGIELITESYAIAITLLAMLFTLKNYYEMDDNLLCKIKNSLENILQLSKDITQTDDLSIAKNKALKVIDVSNETLELFNCEKIEDEEKNLSNYENYDLNDFFIKIISLYEFKIKEKELEFSYNITPDLPKEVYGSKDSLQKIIVNLLDNAYKFTDTGYIHLEINCVNTTDNCRLIIEIEDSGRGIKKDDVTEIFENNSSLAEIKKIVESLDGRIIIHTIYEEGSKFTVVVNQKIVSQEKNKIMTENFIDANYGWMKVVVVDDNADNLKIIKKLLERFLIDDVVYLNNGYDLLKKMKENCNYDVILLDINMPDINGIDTFNELKEIDNFSVPVVALLANEMPGGEQKYIDEGFFAYLKKPIQKDKLTKILEKIEMKSQNKENNISDGIQEIIEPPSIDAKDYLKKKGVDIDNSLELLGDLEMYNDTLKDFLAEVDEKWMKIEKYKLEGNMSEYAVLVHSLKSDCKYLGFMKLADISYQHELSSKANDSNFVNKNFKELEEEFSKVLNIAKDYGERYLN